MTAISESRTVFNFSQHGEQRAILRWAGSARGSFLDLGAYDGVGYSNTRALAMRDWGGICVDAAPDAAATCAARYSDRTDIDVVLAAFDPDGGSDPVTIHWTPGQMYSGLDPSPRDDVDIVPLLMQPLDLDWLARRCGELPGPLFCSIDLEGASIAALRWLLAHTDAACVCVEANTPGDSAEAALLLDGWDRLAENASNAVYARRAS